MLLVFVLSALCAASLKVYAPTGPNTNQLECYEYAYIRYRIGSTELLSKAAYFDLLLVKNNRTVHTITSKSPIVPEGYVSFFPWNEGFIGSGFSIQIVLFDSSERKIRLSEELLGKSKSSVFHIDTCPDDREVTL